MYWILLMLIALVFLHLYQRLQTRLQRRMLSHLPSWPAMPFIGSAYKFFRDGNNFIKYIDKVSTIMEETNLPFCLWLGHKGFLVLSDPEDVRAVSTTNLDKSYIYSFVKSWVGNGLITAPGVIWKKSIKKLGSAFTKSVIDSFQDIFNDHSQILVKNLEIAANGPPFDLRRNYLENITLKALCESFLGINGDDIFDREIIESFNRVSKLLSDRAFNIFLHPDAVYNLTPARKEFENCIKTIKKMTEIVLKKKVDLMKKGNSSEGNPDSTRVLKFFETLWKMKESDPAFTEEMIEHELTTLLFTGHESLALSLNILFLVLGSRPDVQQNLYNEIRSVFGDSKRPVSDEDLASLNYCEAVILESLRLYPPAPAVLRYVDHDVKLKSCTAPAGVTCLFNFWGSGRSKRLWGEDALLYKPERWLDPSSTAKLASTLLSFSTGKRACIGKRYAIILMQTIIVHCMREYEFLSEADKMTFYIDFLLHVKTGNLLQIRKRENI